MCICFVGITLLHSVQCQAIVFLQLLRHVLGAVVRHDTGLEELLMRQDLPKSYFSTDFHTSVMSPLRRLTLSSRVPQRNSAPSAVLMTVLQVDVSEGFCMPRDHRSPECLGARVNHNVLALDTTVL